MKEVFCDVEIQESFAIINLVQEFYNPLGDIKSQEEEKDSDKTKSSGSPIEVAFKFPKEDSNVISKMTVVLDEKRIEA